MVKLRDKKRDEEDEQFRFTEACAPGFVRFRSVLISQGRPRHNRISKVFEPNELLIPIVPCPCNDTSTEDVASGSDVPAARNIKPNTLSAS